MLDVAKVSSKGQVTIPVEFRRRLGIDEGGKVVFVEKEGNIVLLNANRLAFEEFQREMEGAAVEAGLNNEDDVVEMVRDVRRRMWEARHEGDA